MRYAAVCCLAACAVAASAGLGTETAAAQAGEQACAGTGLIATEAPDAAAPTAVGPTLLGPGRNGTAVDSATEPVTGLTTGPLSLGIAGCVDALGTPGGTTLRVDAWSIFGGAIRAGGLRADLVPQPADGSGWRLRAAIEGLVVAGEPVELGPGDQVTVGNWGTLSAEPELATLTAGGVGLRWWRSALQLELTRAHDGLAAGTTVLIGWVAADRQPLAIAATEIPPQTTTTTATTVPTATATNAPAVPPAHEAPAVGRSGHAAAPAKSAKHKAARHKVARKQAVRRAAKHAQPLAGRPLHLTPPLRGGLHTFPVVGDVAWGDTYGAARSDVSGGWHHGDDLFAPLGTPVVAVADGTVFAVGWNSVGGWRLWLMDAQGNQYYYAHLSGYSALAQNNRHVERGQVLGFVGNTGDAVTTWPHVHFEVHPNGLLYLGYDGAVDPTQYLNAWTRLGHVASVPPPVPLPAGASSGEGAIKDFRALLAIRPMKVAPEVAASAAADGRPPERRSDGRPTARRSRPGATAVSVRAEPLRGSGDGYGAILGGVALLGGALLILLFTWRAGRAS